MAYHEKKLELQLTSEFEYTQTCTIPKDYCASAIFTATYVKFCRSVACMVVTFFDLRLLLSERRILELAALTEKNSRQGSWGTYFAAKKLSCSIEDTG